MNAPEQVQALRGGYFRYFTLYLSRAPLPLIFGASNGEEESLDRLATLAGEIIQLKEGRKSVASGSRTAPEREEIILGDQIDEIVYRLFELGPREIATVQETTKQV